MITYKEIKQRVSAVLDEVKVSDYDRAEDVLCGWQIRAWRTRIGGRVFIHLGYKSSWEKTYTECDYDHLVEMLMKYTGAHTP